MVALESLASIANIASELRLPISAVEHAADSLRVIPTRLFGVDFYTPEDAKRITTHLQHQPTK